MQKQFVGLTLRQARRSEGRRRREQMDRAARRQAANLPGDGHEEQSLRERISASDVTDRRQPPVARCLLAQPAAHHLSCLAGRVCPEPAKDRGGRGDKSGALQFAPPRFTITCLRKMIARRTAGPSHGSRPSFGHPARGGQGAHPSTSGAPAAIHAPKRSWFSPTGFQ